MGYCSILYEVVVIDETFLCELNLAVDDLILQKADKRRLRTIEIKQIMRIVAENRPTVFISQFLSPKNKEKKLLEKPNANYKNYDWNRRECPS